MPVCRLCRNDRELEVSHIIPQFVAKRQKADSPNPFLRNWTQPDRRLQDAPKETLLCRQCEGVFVAWRMHFAGDIFTPTMDGDVLTDVVVTREHRRFCASIDKCRASSQTLRMRMESAHYRSFTTSHQKVETHDRHGAKS